MIDQIAPLLISIRDEIARLNKEVAAIREKVAPPPAAKGQTGSGHQSPSKPQ